MLKILHLKKIEYYKNLTFSDSEQPKPKNWSRKTFNCKCNIPIYKHVKDDEVILGRIDIEYIVESKYQENVMMCGSTSKNWWVVGKPNSWKITHIKSFGFDDILYIIHIGYITRGGALTPSPLYIRIESVDKYESMILRQERRKKLQRLNN